MHFDQTSKDPNLCDRDCLVTTSRVLMRSLPNTLLQEAEAVAAAEAADTQQEIDALMADHEAQIARWEAHALAEDQRLAGLRDSLEVC